MNSVSVSGPYDQPLAILPSVSPWEPLTDAVESLLKRASRLPAVSIDVFAPRMPERLRLARRECLFCVGAVKLLLDFADQGEEGLKTVGWDFVLPWVYACLAGSVRAPTSVDATEGLIDSLYAIDAPAVKCWTCAGSTAHSCAVHLASTVAGLLIGLTPVRTNQIPDDWDTLAQERWELLQMGVRTHRFTNALSPAELGARIWRESRFALRKHLKHTGENPGPKGFHEPSREPVETAEHSLKVGDFKREHLMAVFEAMKALGFDAKTDEIVSKSGIRRQTALLIRTALLDLIKVETERGN